MKIRLRQFAPYLLILLGASVAVSAYLQALNYPFVSDDYLYIVGNHQLANLKFTDLWQLLLNPGNSAFEFLPIRDLSFWIDIQLFGQDNPAPLRLHNILLYLASLPLLYATTLRLWQYFRPNDSASAPWAAAAITTLFAIHPALVESVVWISGRKYILPNLFSVLALYWATRTKLEQGFSSRYAGLALLAFVGVMFSKSSYVAVAPIIALLWFIYWQDLPLPQRHRKLLLWPASILLVAALLLGIFIARNEGADSAAQYIGQEALSRPLAILGGLTRASLTTEGRHFFYPVFHDTWFPAMVALGGIVLVFGIVGLVMLLRKRSLTGAALLVFLLLCLPYLQLFPTKPLSLVADRYIALSIWSLIVLLVIGAWQLKLFPRILLLAAFALPWTYQTIERPHAWSSFLHLAQIDQQAYPTYYIPAYYVFKDSLPPYNFGQDALIAANRIPSPEIRGILFDLVQADLARQNGASHEAMNLLIEMGLKLESPPREILWDTPLIAIWERLKERMRLEWIKLLKDFPNDAMLTYNIGLSVLRLDEYQDAKLLLSVTLESPNLPQEVRENTLLNLGFAQIQTDQFIEAESSLNTLLKQSPQDQRALCLLSGIYRATNRIKEAEPLLPACKSAEPVMQH